LPYAVADDEAAAQAGSAPSPSAAELSPAARVEAVLDWLEAHQYLSQERFVESRVHARSARFGNLRIRQELKQHQVALSPEAAQALKESELERARAVRERKFAAWPSSPAERAKQARFLAGRGFSPEVIGRALRGAEPVDVGFGAPDAPPD
jgi:regulatory protein